MYQDRHLSLKAWAAEDRPREKMIRRGKQVLTDAELLAVLLGSGSRGETAVALSQRILHAMGNNLCELSKCSLQELTRFKGVGTTKAIIIQAALELGRRRQAAPRTEKPQITCSGDAYHILAPHLQDLGHEEFWILLLNRANRVIAYERISAGGIAGTVVDARIIFRKAVAHSACSVILCHNHPSGNLQPSRADLDLTAKLVAAGKHLDILVLDHLIITDDAYFSFADEGKM